MLSPMTQPIIGISAWTHQFDTTLGDNERHYSIAAGYVAGITDAGGIPVVLPAIDPSFAPGTVSGLDALVVSGGADIDPAQYGEENTRSVKIDAGRDAWELALTTEARRTHTPFLGVCRGHQILNVASGGTLDQHVWGRADHPPLWNEDKTRLTTWMHEVTFEAGSRVAEVYGKDRRMVNSLHHQAVERVGTHLAVTGTAGDGTVEVLESTNDWWALGVQWHPERLDLADERPLFEALVRAATG